ncbi:MAG TPA: pyridoxal-dependent decarboxylase, partial [Burkholderiaceae bacterium]|nr:pyridoxal-dependent decarboxylase [Burkholderiaceae bacterium]
RNQIPVEVERQVSRWVRDFFQFPDGASGLFVTGTSMANLIALWVARTVALGPTVRQTGIAGASRRLVAYTSAGAHGCVAQAMDLAGLGRDALRIIPMNAEFQMDMTQLERAIAADKAAGLQPFFIAATAGSVDVGAIDPMADIATLAAKEKLWFHVDGAFGALAILAPEIAPRLVGIERADSIALDFHKWAQVPYDAGFILIRDGCAHQNTFSSPVAYLRREERGLAGGSPWPCDFGPDLSRGFRALKAWFTIQVYGTEKLGQVIAGTCGLAQYLKDRIDADPALERLAPVALNIVCFRYRCLNTESASEPFDDEKVDRINADIAVALQESGIAAPSTTIIAGRLAIRAAIVNHRTNRSDIDALIDATLAFGAAICKIA